ncbi:MAG: ATP-binding protein, partial [Candidatus Acidiferrales bacterium]
MSNTGHSSSRNQAGQAPGLGINVGYGDELLAAVFDSSAEALVIIDTAGTIQRANPRARELLHLKEPTRRSLDLGDFLATPAADQLASLWAPRQRPARPQSFDAALTTGFPVRVTLRWILPGTQHLLLCIEDGPVVRRAEAKSRHLEAELRSLLDSVHAGVLLSDPSGSIRFSNARFGQLFGLSMREVEKAAGMDALEVLLAERFRNPADFGAPWRAYASGSGEPRHDELELTRPAGRVFERYSRPVLDAEGHPLGWLEPYRDVTGERQIQSKMLQTEKMAALGQLVSGIAHELNNPLTAIMGYAQLMLGHGLNPNQFSEAKKVYQEAERARRIVKNLLYFARETAPERTQVNVNEIVERTLALRSYELKTENIVVTCELAPGLPQTIADPYQLQQVVLNLLINAEQALLEGRGQGHVLIRTTHTIEGLGSHGVDRIVLEVSDDGPGVSPEISSRIFDPFFTTKQPGLGTGLGLSIVYGIVHQHHGEVTFENQPSGGAHFVVELPVVAVPANARTPLLLEPAGRNGASPRGRILVVEDEPTVAQLVVDVLREEGHQAEAVLD